jgi:hypothetical protein
LLLELEDDEPLAGRAGPPEGPFEPFTGWIGLAAAIDRALAAWRPHQEPDAPTSGS